MLKKITVSATVLGLAALCMAAIPATAFAAKEHTMAASAKLDRPALFVVEASADWCSTCKKIAADLGKIKPGFAQQPVVFFQMDLTNPSTKANSRKLAKLLGLDASIVDVDQRSQVFLVDGKTSEILQTIQGRQSADVYTAAIQKHMDALGADSVAALY
ncbi:MAG: thioredoxin domain-containing protein [Opitutales bacterium]